MSVPSWLPRAKALYEKGHSLATVAKKIGTVSRWKIREEFVKAGIPTRTVKEAQWLWFNRAKKLTTGTKNKRYVIR